MIRRIAKGDIEDVLRLWRSSCEESHPFLTTEFLDTVGSNMRDRTLIAYETDVLVSGGVCAFLSRLGTFVDALFVAPSMQCRGLGKQLLDHAKIQCSELQLSVFAQNPRAVKFYQREGFWATTVKEHRETRETIVGLKWKKQNDV